MFERILIAYDQSPEAESTVAASLALAAKLKAKVLLATVMPPVSGFTTLANSIQAGYIRESESEELQALKSKHQLIQDKAAASGIEVETRILEGSVLDQLLLCIHDFRPDLVTLGLRHHGHGFDLIGTLHRIAHQIDCPIMAVPNAGKFKTA